jgi:superfamily II DNA or RNA helicase
MTDSFSNGAKLRTQLAKDYRQLPALEKKMIQMFSVIYEPINRVSFLECFHHAGLRNENGRPLVNSTLKSYIEGLLKAGLLVQSVGQGPRCHPLLVEIATRDAIKAGLFEAMAKAVEEKLGVDTRGEDGPREFQRQSQLFREVRIGFYRHDMNFINKQIEDYRKYSSNKDKIFLYKIIEQVCNNPFDPDWFLTLPQDFYETGLASILINATLKLTPAQEVLSFLEDECSHPQGRSSDGSYLILAEQQILQGYIQQAQQSLKHVKDGYHHNAIVLRGWLSFLDGNYQQAIEYYTTALQLLKKTTGKQKVYFDTIGGVFFVLALLKDGSLTRLKEAVEYTSIMARQSHHWLSSTYTRLQKIVKIQQGELSEKESVVSTVILPHTEDTSNSIETLISALCLYWVDAKAAKNRLPKLLKPLYQEAMESGYGWLGIEALDLLSRFIPRSPYSRQAAELRQDMNIISLVELIQPQEPWELCLNALANLGLSPPAPVPTQSEQRLVWFVSFSYGNCVIQPREQKINAKGVWSKGRPIALKRLSEDLAEFDYLTPQDIRVCSYIEKYNDNSLGYYGKTEYILNDKAISALIGHPLVFWEDSPTIHVEIVKGEPELLVKKKSSNQLNLEFYPKLPENKEIFTVKETPTRIKVIQINSEHRRIMEILGKENRLSVPASAQERVLTAISAVSGIVTVHSDIGGGEVNAEEVTAETKPHIHLLPVGVGLKVAVLVQPFANGGPYYSPGKGGETVIAEIEGKRLFTTRNLRQEKQLAKGVVAACSTLTRHEEQNGEWLLENPEDCLELLEELQALEDSVVLEWPEGEKLRVSHRASLKDFHLLLQRQGDWFAASGKLELDDNLVLDMQQLLELLEQSPSRFVPLGDGQFLALTQAFRKRLDELRTFAEKHRKGMRFHPLAALAMEDFLEEVGNLQADKHWQEHIQRLKEMQNLQPKLPSTLQAELRDYQLDGFEWLARLAYWGVGACLADQMGLGKTVQALAVILTRANSGPTLIIAPTSVCSNWVTETQRFAPTLNIIQFGSSNRQKVLEELQPFDMLICSYGLLQQEEVAQMLSSVEWQTIVLDEAQSIKNIATKRSQAAMKLTGGFKLITTGTPIENHLGELWNLFRFINPGLLGSLESFNQRFAIPIEKLQDKQARNRLKKLIQPFVLRRTKNQVLEELPSRTEITLHVELSREEIAFYEALRRDAIAKLSKEGVSGGEKHLQVLAEIMKLRRACCNPSLVVPDSQIPSAKLQLFGEVLNELLENRHKALVFSQFVDHLHIIREFLDKQNIHYQYLDGSTPAAERKKRVDAFQSGVGDVFLISLKAGGTGLNLTAADYVIHMDPWWNPAVEDQASDRAHRIGQQRPVTIYRLVAKDTIEEKIVNLHHHKRDLADSLLEGTDISGKISTEELLQLIQQI